MNGNVQQRLITIGLVALLLAPFLGQEGDAWPPSIRSNEGISITGSWSDSCPCRAPCPCWRTGRANVSKCVNVQVYQAHLQGKGTTPTDSVFVLVGVPRHPYEDPELYTLYRERDVRNDLLGGLQGLFEGFYEVKLQDSQQVSISASIKEHSHQVSIPGVLRYEVVSLRKDVVDGRLRRYLYPWLDHPKQWETRLTKYQYPDGSSVAYRRTNALEARFHLDISAQVPITGTPTMDKKRPQP